MRINLFIFLLIILCYSPGFAQKTKVYRAWVTLTNGDQVIGALSVANENGLVILHWDTGDTLATLEGKEIKVIKFRRKGSAGRGAWIGALGGAAIGVILGLEEGDGLTMTAEETALTAGLVMAIPGTFIGVIIGSLPKRFVIKGDNDAYLAQLPEIEQYILHPAEE
jgi:hypothetical protein